MLRIGGTDYGTGSGNSKKEAEQEAAADAWRRLTAPAGSVPDVSGSVPASPPDAAPAERQSTQTGS